MRVLMVAILAVLCLTGCKHKTQPPYDSGCAFDPTKPGCPTGDEGDGGG